MLMVLQSSLPQLNQFDVTNLCSTRLVIQLARVFFGTPKCWALPQSCKLLFSLVAIICPANPSGDISREVKMVISESEQLVMESVKSLVDVVNSPQCGEMVKAHYTQFVTDSFQLINRMLMERDDTSVQKAVNLAEKSCDILLLLSQENTSEFDIPLDHPRVREALDILLPKEGIIHQSENELSNFYALPNLLLGPWMLRSKPVVNELKTAERTDAVFDYNLMAMFWSEILVRLSNIDDLAAPTERVEETTVGDINADLRIVLQEQKLNAVGSSSSDIKAGDLNLGPFVRLVCMCYHASTYQLTCHKYKSALNLRDTDMTEEVQFMDKLPQNTNTLLKHMNIGNLNQLAKLLCDKSCEDVTGKWCVTLSYFLNSYPGVNSSKLYSNVNSTGFNSTAVKQALMITLPSRDLNSILVNEYASVTSLLEDPFTGADIIALLTTHLRVQTSQVDIKTKIQSILDVILSWLEKGDTVFFSDNKPNFEDSRVISSIMQILHVFIKHHSEHFNANHWDRILCALITWIQTLAETIIDGEGEMVPSSCMTLSAVCKVLASLSSLMESKEITKEVYPPTLLDEWKGFYTGSINESLLNLFLRLSSTYNKETNRSLALYLVLVSLSEYIYTIPYSDLIETTLTPITNNTISQGTPLTDKLQTLLTHTCNSLLSPHPSVVGAAYHLLTQSMPAIMHQWVTKTTSLTGSAEEKPAEGVKIELPNTLLTLLTSCEAVVSSALMERSPLSGHCVVQPHTDSYTYTMCYLLTWSVIHW